MSLRRPAVPGASCRKSAQRAAERATIRNKSRPPRSSTWIAPRSPVPEARRTQLSRHATSREASRVARPLPGTSEVADKPTDEPQLAVGGGGDKRPAVVLRSVFFPRAVAFGRCSTSRRRTLARTIANLISVQRLRPCSFGGSPCQALTAIWVQRWSAKRAEVSGRTSGAGRHPGASPGADVLLNALKGTPPPEIA